MKHKIYLFEFQNGVHFGSGDLDTAEYTFRADTLFSALCQEAVKLDCLPELFERVSKGKILFSDAFPYKEKGRLYLPTPIVMGKMQDHTKEAVRTAFLPAEKLAHFLSGNYIPDSDDLESELGRFEMKTSVAIQGKEEPEPYRVKAFYFYEGNGLYVIARLEDDRSEALFEELLESLSYSGIGGKRSSGYGNFSWMGKNVPKGMEKQLADQEDYGMLISSALPLDAELDRALEDATYRLIKRSGFVSSETYAQVPLRKRDAYLFASGSCFKNRFLGNVLDVSSEGEHPVYRYAKALFVEVNVCTEI